MFSLLVRRDGLIEPPPMQKRDAHCHILPGLDDGPQDAESSLAIARLLVEIGVETVVATPHIISDVYPLCSEQIRDAAAALSELFARRGLKLGLEVGAEYYVERDLLNRIEQGDVLAFGEERYVLFEAPVESEPLLLAEVIFELCSAGYTPLLAHAERYRFLQNNRPRAQELKRLGAKLQVNHPSFHLPKTSRRGEMARWLYLKGLVDQLGTDIHHVTTDDRLLASRGDNRLYARLASR